MVTKNQDQTLIKNLEVFCNKYLDSSLVSYQKGPYINDVSNVLKKQSNKKNKTRTEIQTKENSFLLVNNLAGNKTPKPKSNQWNSRNESMIKSPLKTDLSHVQKSGYKIQVNRC